jgi:hypothetical protein
MLGTRLAFFLRPQFYVALIQQTLRALQTASSSSVIFAA